MERLNALAQATAAADRPLPSAVQSAFAPLSPYQLTFAGWLALHCAGVDITRLSTPSPRDILLIHLALTHPETILQALRSNSLENLLQNHAASLDLATTIADLPAMIAALSAPFASLQPATAEKKTPPPSAGGSH